MRCFGHIVNLVVKAFLYGEIRNRNILQDIAGPEPNSVVIESTEADMVFWRTKGVYTSLGVTRAGGYDPQRALPGGYNPHGVGRRMTPREFSLGVTINNERIVAFIIYSIFNN